MRRFGYIGFVVCYFLAFSVGFSQSKKTRFALIFNESEEVSEDYLFSTGDFYEAFKPTNVEVIWLNNDSAYTSLGSKKINNRELLESYSEGFMVMEEGREMKYLGGYANFYQNDDPNPIEEALAYFGHINVTGFDYIRQLNYTRSFEESVNYCKEYGRSILLYITDSAHINHFESRIQEDPSLYIFLKTSSQPILKMNLDNDELIKWYSSDSTLTYGEDAKKIRETYFPDSEVPFLVFFDVFQMRPLPLFIHRNQGVAEMRDIIETGTRLSFPR